MDIKYRLIFRGFKAGISENEARENLGKLFNLPTESVQAIFSESERTVKSGVTLDDAVRYQKAIDTAGVICVVEPDQPSALLRDSGPLHQEVRSNKVPEPLPKSLSTDIHSSTKMEPPQASLRNAQPPTNDAKVQQAKSTVNAIVVVGVAIVVVVIFVAMVLSASTTQKSVSGTPTEESPQSSQAAKDPIGNLKLHGIFDCDPSVNAADGGTQVKHFINYYPDDIFIGLWIFYFAKASPVPMVQVGTYALVDRNMLVLQSIAHTQGLVDLITFRNIEDLRYQKEDTDIRSEYRLSDIKTDSYSSQKIGLLKNGIRVANEPERLVGRCVSTNNKDTVALFDVIRKNIPQMILAASQAEQIAPMTTSPVPKQSAPTNNNDSRQAARVIALAYAKGEAQKGKCDFDESSMEVTSGKVAGVEGNVVVARYGLEGCGGSNTWASTLAVIASQNGKWEKIAAKVGPGFDEIAIVNEKISAKVIDYGPNDARCCPSISKTTVFAVQGSELVPQ